MPAAQTNRRLLIALAAIGVVAGVVGIGASIAGVDDDREPSAEATATPEDQEPSAPPEEGGDEPAAEAPGEPPAAPEDEEAAEAQAEAELEAAAAVTRAEAEQIAQGQVAGPIDRSGISDETGSPVWEVRIDTDSGHTDVLIDATTGEVLEIDD